MNVVEKIRTGWASWLFQGIPAAAVVLGAILHFGAVYGSIDERVKTLENDRTVTAKQMRELTQKIDDLSEDVRELKNRLQNKGDISVPRYTRHGVSYSGEAGMPSDYNPQR